MTSLAQWMRSRRGQFILIAVATALIALELPLTAIGDWLGAWYPTVGKLTDTVILLGPWAVILGAIRGRAFRRGGLPTLVTAASRPPLLIHARESGRAAAPVLAGWAFTAAAMLLATSTTHPYGSPPGLQLATIPLEIVAYVAIGYALGYQIPHPATPVVLALLVLVGPWEAIAHSGQGFDHLTVADQTTLDYYRKTFGLLIGQLVLFIAVTLLALAAAARQRVLAVLTLVAVAISVAVLTRMPWDHAVVEAHDRAALICHDDNGLRICLARVHANNYRRMNDALQPILPVMAPRFPHGVTMIERNPFTPYTGDDIEIDIVSGSGSAGTRMDRDAMLTVLASVVLGYPPYRCGPIHDLPDDREGLTLNAEVSQWYLWRFDIDQRALPSSQRPAPERAVSSGLAQHLRNTPDAAVITWLTSKPVQAELAECATTTLVPPP